MIKYSIGILFLLTTIFGSASLSFGQTLDPVEKNLWYNTEKTAKIQIYKATDGKFYGKIVWLKVPEVEGKPKIDIHNPDPKKQRDPILGLVILRGFTKDGENGYDDGTIYDPKNGKTYSCKMTRDGDKLDVHGYIGFSLLGRSEHWTKAE